MHLIEALAAGVEGASNGTALVTQFGTSQPVTYYLDFGGTQGIAGSTSGIALDSNGGATVYVNQLVNVTVLDVNGVTVRAFVAGVEAPGVEVISQSFTGTSYTDGSTGTGKPTTLQTVLDAWLTSAGSTDFKVLVNGSATALSAAVAGLIGLFFNVKSYGAIGDGVADDGASIQAAMTAATGSAGFGGIVFFPPGTYRTTTTLSWAPGIMLMGCTAVATRIRVDNAALASMISVTGTDTGDRVASGIWFGALSNFTAPLVLYTAGAQRVTWLDCAFGGDTFMKGQAINCASSNQKTALTVVQRCHFFSITNASCLIFGGTGRTIVRDSDFIVTTATYSGAVIAGGDGLTVDNCNFDASGVTSGSIVYVSYTPSGATTWGACVFTGNRFAPNTTVVPVCLQNGGTSAYDAYENGNTFGDVASGINGITPYGGSLGYNSFTQSLFPNFHGTRAGRVQFLATDAATVAIPADIFESVYLTRTNNTVQTLNFPTGRPGDKFTLFVQGAPAVNTTETWGTHTMASAAISPSITITAAAAYAIEFAWVPNASRSGAWFQTNDALSTAVVW